MARAPHLVLVALAAVLASGTATPGATRPAAYAVRTVDAPESFSQALRRGFFFRWVAPRSDKQVDLGPRATGEEVIVVDFWPLEEDTRIQVAHLPLAVDRPRLTFDGTEYRGSKGTLALRIPETTPRTWLVTGTSTTGTVSLVNEILSRLERGNASPVDYLLQENPWLERSGQWRRRGADFVVDRTVERDQLAQRERALTRLARVVSGPWVELRVAGAQAQRRQYRELSRRLEAEAEAMAARIPLTLPSLGTPIVMVVEPDYVQQGRHTGAIGEAVAVTGSGEGQGVDVHLVFDPQDEHAYRFALAQVLLQRAQWPRSLPPWIATGCALWLSEDWYGRTYKEWIPTLSRAGVLPNFDILLQKPGTTPSPEESVDLGSRLLWAPAVAGAVDLLPGPTLARKLGPEAGDPTVEGPAPVALLPETVSSKLLGTLESLGRWRPRTEGPPPAEEGEPVQDPPSRHDPAFLKGVSFAMLNRLEGGYHAPSIEGQLQRLRRLGGNAVSLMPFASQRSWDRPGLRILNHGPTSETDIGLLHAARRARAHGLTVLWKPHVWVSGGHWSGEISMTNEEDWRAWWQEYRRYIVHQAILATWAQADLFSVGVELGATVHREEEWNHLIAAVRRVFPGPITYAANWYGDFDRAPFWDRLDYLGVDAYYSLAPSGEADLAALRRGAGDVMGKLRDASKRHNRPVLLTEVGFAARRVAWKDPHREGGEYSEEHQALAYRALLESLAAHANVPGPPGDDAPAPSLRGNRGGSSPEGVGTSEIQKQGEGPWLAGLFVWKAFSEHREASKRPDFRFLGRKAEAVIGDFYRTGGDLASQPTKKSH